MQVNTWASIVLIVLLAPSFPSIGITGWFDKAMRVIPTYYLSEALKLSMAGTVSSQLWMYLASAVRLHRYRILCGNVGPAPAKLDVCCKIKTFLIH